MQHQRVSPETAAVCEQTNAFVAGGDAPDLHGTTTSLSPVHPRSSSSLSRRSRMHWISCVGCAAEWRNRHSVDSKSLEREHVLHE